MVAFGQKLMIRQMGFVALLLGSSVLSPVPAHACDSCAAMVQIPINTGLQVAQIAATTAAIVAAIGEAGAGSGSAESGPTIAAEDAAQNAAGQGTAVAELQTFHKVRAETTSNTQSTNCRLATKNALAPVMEDINKSAKKLQERGVLEGIFFNKAATPQRVAAGALYRLCQNGQLAPQDFGTTWYTVNNCINDSDSVHDFLKISTILDSPVLIPVTGTAAVAGNPPKMDVLNNPEAYTPADVAAVWNGLNDKQKKYVGATRYCENLILSKLRPQTIRNDAAMTAANMSVIAQNMSAASALSSVRDVCISELSRRVALDPALMPAGPSKTAMTTSSDKIINFLVYFRGADARELYAYASAADRNAVNVVNGHDIGNPIGGATPTPWVSQYVIDRHPRDYGLSIKCVGYGDTGTDAAKTGNAIACAQMAATWEKNEAQRTKNFIEAVAAIDQTPEFSDAVAAHTRARYNPMPQSHPLLQDASLNVPGFDQRPIKLDEMLNTMGAVQHPSKTASRVDSSPQP
jgi:hypothetical protein